MVSGFFRRKSSWLFRTCGKASSIVFPSQSRANPDLLLVFRAGGRLIAPGYHLTEVKRVTYETMDCGAASHRWAETHFEIWVPPLAGVLPARSHMEARKFLSILDRVAHSLPLDGEAPALIHAGFEGQAPALYGIASVVASDGRLWIELTPGRIRCKSVERKVADLTGGCCGKSDTKEAACCA